MEFIIHRINKIIDLKRISKEFGTEIDIRSNGSNLILNHEPFSKGDSFVNYLENYKHKTLVLNLKEAGIEQEVIKLVKKYKIKSYFLLDVEMPYMYSATKEGIKDIAVRFSEYEDIALANYFKRKLHWIWIDTATKFPINKNNLKIIKKFKSILVCPERWGRATDIKKYKLKMNNLKFQPFAIMTNIKYIKKWMS
tara:strand:- start:637 stop:1221 length:585 start_codon:yes stop_codon:yes gene_type:complete